MTTRQDPILINDHGVAAMLGVSRATVWRMVSDDRLPDPLKLGRLTRWRRDWILAAIDAADAARVSTFNDAASPRNVRPN